MLEGLNERVLEQLEEGSTRLRESVAAEYQRALEVFKREIAWEEKRKQQAAEIAELFSIWLQADYNQEKDVNLIRYELQKKYWELALWLDAPVLRAVNDAVTVGEPAGIRHKKALIAVRRIYLGEEDPISPEELNHWGAVPVSPRKPKGKEQA